MSDESHAIRAHSVLGASSSDRWLNCPGSIALIAEFPKPPRREATELGTAAHELAEQCFKKTPAARYYIGKKKFNGFDVDEEMAEAVQGYVDYVRVLRNRLDGELLIEKRIHLKHIHPDLFGTCDAIVMQEFGELHVIDYKHGEGYKVDVEENSQAMYYALGALEFGDFEKVFIHIYQPRIAEEGEDPFQVWETTPERLREFGKLLRLGALATKKKDAPLNPGKWCIFCPAQGGCPALHARAMTTARTDFEEPKLPEIRRLTDEQLVKVVLNRKPIESWFKAVDEYVLERLKNGDEIPGLKLVHGRPYRKWANETEAQIYLQKQLKFEAFKSKLLSPAQAEAKLGKAAVAPLIETCAGKVKAASELDSRPAVNDAKNDFEAIESEEVSEDDF